MLDYFSAYSSISSIFFSHSQFFFLFQRIKSSDDMKPPVCYMLCEISVNTFQIQNRIVNIDWRFLLDNSDVFFLLPSSHALAWWKWSDCHHHHRRYQRHQYQKPLPKASTNILYLCACALSVDSFLNGHRWFIYLISRFSLSRCQFIRIFTLKKWSAPEINWNLNGELVGIAVCIRSAYDD